jgi:hypothetical protein
MDNMELCRQYRELDRDCACFSYELSGGKDEERKIFIPNEANMEKAWKRFEELKERAASLEEPDAVFALVRHHFEDFLDSQKYALEDARKHPEGKFLYMHWMIENTSRLSRKPDEERCQKMVGQLEEMCEVSDTFLELIKKGENEEEQKQAGAALFGAKATLETFRMKLEEYFPTFTQEQRSRVDTAILRFEEVLLKMADALPKDTKDKAQETKEPEDDLSITVKMEKEEYRTLLAKRLGVSLDELLDWHKEEIEKTRSEVFEIAKKLHIPEPAPKTMEEVNEILFKYEGPCQSPEEMLERANEYLKRTRALAHEYVKLPEDESCLCVEISDSCKDSYPWGGYEGGDFSVRPIRGQMFLNNHNYQNVTDGWIKLNALHEAYPGHHVQYVRAEVDPRPETVKIGAKLVPVLEGTCLRTERAFEFIYGEDPFFPLFVAYRRHHASVRIYVDLMLYYHGATLEEAVKTYEKELGFDRGTARSQVLAHQNMPGYFTCYYYGMKKICEWEKEYGFSKKDFTELLFSAGYISIERLGELARLTPQERERYYHDFSSLL